MQNPEAENVRGAVVTGGRNEKKLRDQKPKEAEEECGVFTKISLQGWETCEKQMREVETDAALFLMGFLFCYFF